MVLCTQLIDCKTQTVLLASMFVWLVCVIVTLVALRCLYFADRLTRIEGLYNAIKCHILRHISSF